MKKNELLPSYIVIGALALFAAMLIVVLALPHARRKIQGWLGQEERIVVAKLQKELAFANGSQLITVVKLKKNHNLLVEIYRHEQDSQKLISTFEFPNEYDAQLVQLHGTSNLFIADKRLTGQFEIVVPAMDQQMNPRTHFIEFNPETQDFRLKMPPSEP